MKPLQTAYQQIFRTHNLNDVSLQEVEAYVEAHPYYSLANLALAQKKKDDASLQKAALYFNNPIWLQGLLQPNAKAFPHIEYRREPEYSKVYPEVDAIVEVPNEPEEIEEVTAEPIIIDTHSPTEAIETVFDKDDDGDIKDIEISEKLVEDMVAHDDHFAHAAILPLHQGVSIDQTDLDNGDIKDIELSEKAIEDLVEHDDHFEHKHAEQIDKAVSTEKELPFVYSANVVELSELNEMAKEDRAEASKLENIEEKEVNFQEVLPAEEPIAIEEPLIEEAQQKIGSAAEADQTERIDFETIEEQLPEFKSSSLAAAAEVLKRETLMSEEIETEAFHTIDYFASQGIKLLDTEQKDKLSSQLKSFTGWLKSMKKFGKDPVITGDEEREKEIERIAEMANVSKDILTEAMAVVLEKQGKYAKSIDLYQKLSLLNPNKSPYFAAKINRLKTFL